MRNAQRGISLMEVLVAAVIGTLMAGGTLLAFLLATKHTRSSLETVDAAALAAQTLEKFRNKIACDEGTAAGTDPWFDAACQGQAIGPTGDAVPADHPILGVDPSATRTYTVTPADCDGVGGADDCFKVEVKVHWNKPQ